MNQTELSTELAGQRYNGSETGQLVAQAEAIIIGSNDDYLRACEFEKGLRALDRKIVEHHATRKRMADQLHKRLVAEEREDRAPIDLALKTIKPKRITWEEDRKREQREEQERRDREQKRLDEERRLAEAERLEAAGHAQEAERVLEREEPQTRIHVPVDLPSSGIAKRWYYGWREDQSILRDLVEAAAKDDRYLVFLDWHRKNIYSHVQDYKDLANVPGVKTWKERR